MNRFSFQSSHRFAQGFTLDAAFDTQALVTALFGPSGSGKTSILAMIAGLVRPTIGNITLGDRTLLDTRQGIDEKPERRRVGLVFQDQLLFPHLTVERNLEYGRRRRNGRSSGIEPARVIEVLELGEFLPRWPRHLSGGERQRVALGRALLSGPDLLLMDEPLAALHDTLKDRILGYLERIVSEWRVPTIYVSHNAAEVRRLAQRVIVLEEGRVVQSGSPDELFLGNSFSSPEVSS